ncbi:cysteine desulfurase family protein [Algoriphagus chordae]|uniref:cysteine desulfurase family protein n=1 Tax=Algoriphagus chordae TaxID=237019 RepID=UPI0013141CED|nr:cysteine desulfurase family protein [Algoriphagus chordae]
MSYEVFKQLVPLWGKKRTKCFPISFGKRGEEVSLIREKAPENYKVLNTFFAHRTMCYNGFFSLSLFGIGISISNFVKGGLSADVLGLTFISLIFSFILLRRAVSFHEWSHDLITDSTFIIKKIKKKLTDSPIYLDYASTTPLDPRVFEAMRPYFMEDYGNAASNTHTYGERASIAVKESRKIIADTIHAIPEEIHFTSGATEAINLALKGAFLNYGHQKPHIITVQTEHKAVLDTCAYLEEIGADVTYLSVNSDGLVDIEQLESSIRKDTLLVSIMYANNETGVLHDIQRIGKICKSNQVLFFTDATQAFGKIPLNVLEQSIDMLCFSAHKIYGPKGVGGLYVKKGIKLTPQIHGGGHEFGLRSGTLNVPGIVGLAKAIQLCQSEMEEVSTRLEKIRDDFEEEMEKAGKIKVNGKNAPRLPHFSNFQLLNEEAESFILRNRNKLAVAQGSACNSALIQPSHVLKAMGLSDQDAENSIRISWGNGSNSKTLEKSEIEILF